MVQVGIRRAGDLQGVHANVVERLVVDTVGLVRVLDQLVDGQGGVVRLDDGVRDLRHSDRATWRSTCQLRTKREYESHDPPWQRA